MHLWHRSTVHIAAPPTWPARRSANPAARRCPPQCRPGRASSPATCCPIAPPAPRWAAILTIAKGKLPAGAGGGAFASVPLLIAAYFGVAIIFFALYFWSRKSPLPAAIVGLCLYATLVAINVAVTLGSIGQTQGRGGI